MKKKNNNLDDAVKALKNEPISEGPPKEILDDTLRKLTDASWEELRKSVATTEKIKSPKKLIQLSLSAVIIIVLGLLLISIFTGPEGQEVAEVGREAEVFEAEDVVEIAEADLEVSADRFAVRLEKELESIEEFFAAGDVNGLAAMLNEAMYESKIAAANYLGKIGDWRALSALEQLSFEYGPDEADNPYARVLEALKAQTETTESTDAAAGRTEAVVGDERFLEFVVIEKETSAPLSEVVLRIMTDSIRSTSVTDTQGRCPINLGGGRLSYIRISASKEGFVPMIFSYPAETGRYQPATEFPDKHTLSMSRSTSIGGYVRNEQGEAIEGVTVYVSASMGDESERAATRTRPSTTDAEGYWQCDTLPEGFERIRIRLEHPEYSPFGPITRTADESQFIEELRERVAGFRMEKGLSITGYVFDLKGEPIEGALVAQSDDRWSPKFRTTPTDVEGFFSFSQIESGSTVLTVQAEGYGPALKEIIVHEGLGPIEFALGPGNTIRGQVIDPNGRPLEARLFAYMWRGHRSIDWEGSTDSEGYFEWNNAPADEVFFGISSPDYMSEENFPMSRDVDQYIIVLYPPLVIQGEVVDAETNEPIDSFRVITGTGAENAERAHWFRDYVLDFANGKYETKITRPHGNHFIRIEAAGYKPGVSREIYNDESNVVLDFRLEKATEPASTVYLPDGSPAAGVEVVACFAGRSVSITCGRNMQKDRALFSVTDADGKFALPKQEGKYILGILHNEGYAEVTGEQLAEGSGIFIEPWGRVEGQLFVGGRAGANEEVSAGRDVVYDPHVPVFWHKCTTETDAEGRFSFERLPPGGVYIGHSHERKGYELARGNFKRIEVMPGETVNVIIGGTGRSVFGRLVLPAEYEGLVDWSQVTYELVTQPPMLSYPSDYNDMTEDEKRAWYEDWKKTEGGLAFVEATEEYRREARVYPGSIENDGTFIIEDVAAGDYFLHAKVTEEPAYDPNRTRGRVLGLVRHEFEVPDSNEVLIDEPLDLGSIELKVRNVLRLGDTAPELEADTIDGYFTKLANFKGRFVVLFFFSSSDSEAAEQIPGLMKIYNRLIEGGRFYLISLAVDETPEDTREFIEQNQLQGNCCFIGSTLEAELAREYGVDSLPYIFLIDPEGRIAAIDPTVGELSAMLDEALGM